MYRNRKCDEMVIRTGSSGSNNSRCESSSFESVQWRSNESQYGRKKGSVVKHELGGKGINFKKDQGERHTNNSKRLNWPFGRVIELYPGKDGIKRVAKLRVANGFLIRPLQKRYPLEISVSNLPSDIALGENFLEPNKDSDGLKSPEVPGPSPPAPNPVPKVSLTRCGQRIAPRQRLNL
ncbi:DUF5641 domain-containing protein [Trichonephila clavipes]|nr:DUF5641 domain-containing protein [Trichonephila clavipes]